MPADESRKLGPDALTRTCARHLDMVSNRESRIRNPPVSSQFARAAYLPMLAKFFQILVSTVGTISLTEPSSKSRFTPRVCPLDAPTKADCPSVATQELGPLGAKL